MSLWLHIAGYVLIAAGMGVSAIPGFDHVGQAITATGAALAAATGIPAVKNQ